MAKLWRGYLAPCGEVTKVVARLLSLLWRGYQICGEITCGEVTLWRGYSAFCGVLDYGMPNLDSVLTTLNTNTETNTAIHSSQFDSVGRTGNLLAALPCQK